MPDHNTHTFRFLLDGLAEPADAGRLTGLMTSELNLPSRCDPAGMWLDVDFESKPDESQSNTVAALAARFGLCPRDRIGASFVPSVTGDQLVKRVQHEWASRFATGLVFLLPALGMHYLTPLLTTGPRYVPHGIEAALVGWSILAATWPAVFQGLLSLRHRVITPDLMALIAIVTSFGFGLWQTATGAEQTTLHVTAYAILAVSLQRLVLWRRVHASDGLAHRLAPTRRLLAFILLLAAVTAYFDFNGAYSVMLAVPVLIGPLTITRPWHPATWLISLTLFACFVAASPLLLSPDLLAMRLEGAFLFTILLTAWCSPAPRKTTA
ncbi:MAG: hypothetical protein D8M59_12160 [Planctomycetes bacterium]|nr:hypothetical protein [Planctomycetota bacterium]NOG53560.1 hypothetical protein [Planctomycetota bacterium]